MKTRLLFLIPLIGMVCISCSKGKKGSTSNVQNSVSIPDGYDLLWNDEFDGDALSNDWSCMIGNGHEYGNPGWGNGELEYYQEENAFVEDGQLHIVAKREKHGEYDYTSARIRTAGKFAFTYGKVEAKIALPGGKGMWPAFWMLPEEFKYGGWPDSGEIDIMEANGGSLYGTSAALHYSRTQGVDTYDFGYHSLNVREGITITDFHIYGLEWEEEEIRFYVDDDEVLKVPMRGWSSGTVDKEINPRAPFDRDFHFLLNVAVGGNYVNNVEPDLDFTQSEMLVDYIRVYQYK